jgi:hypothetical protein
MHVADVSLIGWIHGFACVAALLTGAWNILTLDRGRWHRLRGFIYVGAMILANLLVFAIYDFDMDFASGRAGPGIFGFFHWLAISALLFTSVGWFASLRQRHGVWAYVHPVAMLLSYYVLAGGLVNEMFARIDVLRDMAYVVVDGQRRFGSRIIGLSQFAVMVATFLLIVLYTVRVSLKRRKRSQGRKTMQPAVA